MFHDLREFLAALEADGEVTRIGARVDLDWEVGAICREVSDRRGPVLIFERPGDFNTPLLVGLLGTRERYAKALGTDTSVDANARRWREALAGPVQPLSSRSAPCQEVKADPNFWKNPFPVPKWHPLDATYMLGTFHAVISRDPETGRTNLGTYRSAIYDEKVLGCAFNPRKHMKVCTVVDEDIDPWNPERVEWAAATCVQASRDVSIMTSGHSSGLDPSKPPSAGMLSDKMGIDATRPIEEYRREQEEFPELADPTPEQLAQIRQRWREYGFTD